MSDSTQEEAHTGPIKTPVQLLWAAFFAFVVPIFVIIGLVYYVTSDSKPAGTMRAARDDLAGVTPQELERDVTARIQKVGTVEIRDANRPLKTGEEVFKAQCAACHATGVAGAPKFGDKAAWAPRIKTGFDALFHSASKGKNAMPPQAGGDFEDLEVARAVVYMANAGGANFPEPKAPAAPAAPADGAPAAAAPAAPAAAAPAPAPVVAAAPAAAPAPAAPAAPAAAAGAGEALYKQTCFACHGTGVAGAPKFGDKAAWAPRLAQGIDTLVQHAIHGKNAMPPRGGSNASDAQIRAAVQYMANAAK